MDGVHQVARNYKMLALGAINNDALIIGPGGLFPFDNKIKVLIYYLIIKFWKILNKKVIFFGIGISEQMSEFSAFLWRKMAENSELFITRSEEAFKRLCLQKTDNVHTMADAVFGSSYFCNEQNTKDNRVVVSVANLKQDNKKATKDAIEKWIELIEWLLSKDYGVDLIAFRKGADDEMVDDIASDIRLKDKNIRIIHYAEASSVVPAWSKYKFSICMRFHSLVLSVLAGVPAVPIAYGHKTISLANRSGLSNYMLLWNNFQNEYFGDEIDVSLAEIIDKIEKLSCNLYSIREDMKENRKELIDSATKAFTQLKSVLYQYNKLRS